MTKSLPQNTVLRLAREALGLSQYMLARLVKGHIQLVSQLERLEITPFDTNGKLKDLCFSLSCYLGVSEEELFPRSLYGEEIEENISKDLVPFTMGNYDPFKALESRELTSAIDKAVKTLSPRQQKVMDLRYGLRDEAKKPIRKLAKILGIGRTRIGQIEEDALRKLRQFSRLKRLAIFANIEFKDISKNKFHYNYTNIHHLNYMLEKKKEEDKPVPVKMIKPEPVKIVKPIIIECRTCKFGRQPTCIDPCKTCNRSLKYWVTRKRILCK